jgi:LemA protein
MRYNDSVRVYNTHIKSFPANLIAGFFGFKEKDYFEAEAGAKEVPKVKF